jgi:exodeoxyribonuclease-5
MGIEFNSGQLEAIYKAEKWWKHSTNQVFEISGAAGTGKTTLVKYIIEKLGIGLENTAFVAYMGKAAMQLARNGLPAKTIHSFIYDCIQEPVWDEEGKPVYTSAGYQKRKLVFKLKDKDTIPENIELIVVDEASMVSKEISEDLISFGIPIIAMGDLNQLPPVFGNSYFLVNPDVILTQIMRQAEGSPIIYLSQEVLHNRQLQSGQYGDCSVMKKSDFLPEMLKDMDVVLTGTNKLRYSINDLYRSNILDLRRPEIPNVGEKLICRRNNWDVSIKSRDDEYYLVNGLSGIVDYSDVSSYNGKKMEIDFKPDFLSRSFKNLVIDYKHLFAQYGTPEYDAINLGMNPFEFAYAITVHLSQGSQYDNVMLFAERGSFDNNTFKKLMYTGITRAKKRITILI